MHRRLHIRRVEMRIHGLDLFDRDLAHIDIEGAGERGLPIDLFLALVGQRHSHRAVLPHAGADAGFGFQLDIEVGGIFGEPRHVLRGAQLADEAGRMPCRA